VSRVQFQKPCAAAPARAIERAVRHLLAAGYGLNEQSESQASLVFMRGSATSAALDKHRHQLDLVSDGKSLHFDFHSGLGSSGYVTKKERNHLDAVAAQTADAAHDPVVAPAPPDETSSFRCRYCGGLTPSEEPSCRSCGAANFV
jgi:hypothetical protein